MPYVNSGLTEPKTKGQSQFAADVNSIATAITLLYYYSIDLGK